MTGRAAVTADAATAWGIGCIESVKRTSTRNNNCENMEIAMETETQTNIQIRWLIHRDMKNVLPIENDSFDHPWTEDEFLDALRTRNCIGMVAERDQKIVGFMIYELHKGSLILVNLAVHADHRREQVGSQMIGKLIDKLSSQRRTHLDVDVRESNLSAQLFFQAMGFEAVSIVRQAYEDTDESAYVMRYSVDATTCAFRNRITDFDVA